MFNGAFMLNQNGCEMSDVSAFVNRLNKNFRHYSKWARRQPTNAWRVYDKDVPQYPLAIDMYAGYCHLQEYDNGWKLSDQQYAAWLADVKRCITEVTGVSAPHIVIKTRRRQKGDQQYEKFEEEGNTLLVEEFGQTFSVNLHTYLDTGLFLDHRNTRRRVRDEAKGARFLNLFAYTSSFTVYAAAGGAIRSESVDLSNTYLQWSKRNFELNGIDLARHQLVRADVFSYLLEAKAKKKQFDLIVMDPPTFSNSKKMTDILDVQRDHTWLINQAMQLLAPKGTLYFSTNSRRFELDPALSVLYQIDDISKYSIPDDFRNKKIHHCFKITE